MSNCLHYITIVYIIQLLTRARNVKSRVHSAKPRHNSALKMDSSLHRGMNRPREDGFQRGQFHLLVDVHEFSFFLFIIHSSFVIFLLLFFDFVFLSSILSYLFLYAYFLCSHCASLSPFVILFFIYFFPLCSTLSFFSFFMS
jgi:hypothetical protein